MRYVIIPLIVLSYFYWIFVVVKDLINYSKKDKYVYKVVKPYTFFYLMLHAVIILFSLINLTIKYW